MKTSKRDPRLRVLEQRREVCPPTIFCSLSRALRFEAMKQHNNPDIYLEDVVESADTHQLGLVIQLAWDSDESDAEDEVITMFNYSQSLTVCSL